MQRISEEYLRATHKIDTECRLHRLVSLLIDTHYDDLTTDRIEDLERQVESFRWMNANGDRVDQ